MKRLCIITLILFTVPLCSFAPSKKVSIIDIWESKPICKDIMLEYRKVKILNAIIKIEKPITLQQAKDAYKRELAVGILQIRPVMVDEVNRILGYRKYSHCDAADSTKADGSLPRASALRTRSSMVSIAFFSNSAKAKA